MTTTAIPYRDLRTRAEEIADAELKERILAGIALLEEQYGPNWVEHLNPDSLVLRNAKHCVLGQLYGDYADGCKKLDIFRVGGAYGFTLTEEQWNRRLHRSADDDWNELTEAWKVVIAP